jgi:hypothetical protein
MKDEYIRSLDKIGAADTPLVGRMEGRDDL